MSRREVELSDLPQWAQRELQRVMPNRRPHCYIEPCAVASIGGVWHEQCRRWVTGYHNGELKRGASCYYDSLLNATAEEQAMYFGGKITLPIGGALLVISSYPRTATLYINPADAPPVIEPPVNSDLSDFELAVLYNHVCLNSRGRKEAFWRYGINKTEYKAAVTKLAALGYIKVNKAGASQATLNGRNLNTQVRERKGFQWGDSYWYNHNRRQ